MKTSGRLDDVSECWQDTRSHDSDSKGKYTKTKNKNKVRDRHQTSPILGVKEDSRCCGGIYIYSSTRVWIHEDIRKT